MCNACSHARLDAPGYATKQRCCKMCSAPRTAPRREPQQHHVLSRKVAAPHVPTLETLKEQSRGQAPQSESEIKTAAEQQSSTTESTLLPARVTYSTNTLPDHLSLPDRNKEAAADSDEDDDILNSPISNNNSIALKSNASSLQMGLQVLQVTMQSINQSVTINVSIYPRETVRDLVSRLGDQMWALVHGVRRSRRPDEFAEFKKGIVCTNDLSATIGPDVPLAHIAMERHPVIMCAPGASTFSFGSQLSTGSPTPVGSSANFFLLRHSFPSAPPEMHTQDTEIFE